MHQLFNRITLLFLLLLFADVHCLNIKLFNVRQQRKFFCKNCKSFVFLSGEILELAEMLISTNAGQRFWNLFQKYYVIHYIILWMLENSFREPDLAREKLWYMVQSGGQRPTYWERTTGCVREKLSADYTNNLF